jgi:hypothetical protein
MIKFFLQGANAAPIVEDGGYGQPRRIHGVDENGTDPIDISGSSDFGPGLRDAVDLEILDATNLAIFDEPNVSIRYDGYLALARHAYNQPAPFSPLTFLSNVDPVVMATKMGELGFDIASEQVTDAERLIVDRVKILNDKVELILFIVTVTDLPFRDIFFSAEDWVNGKVYAPFLGVTEEGTCPRYKHLLFYNGLSHSETAYVEVAKIGNSGKSYDIDVSAEDGPVPSLVENVVENPDVGEPFMIFLRKKFKEWNRSDPSTLTRGGGSEKIGNSLGKALEALTPSRHSRRYFHADTDPILTIAIMMFTCLVWRMGDRNFVSVDIDDHGYTPSDMKTYNVVPQYMDLSLGAPGYTFSYWIREYLNGDYWYESPIVTFKAPLISGGETYRDIHLFRNGFISAVPGQGYHIYLLFWSTRLMNALFRVMYPEVSKHRTLGQYARVVKDGLFWFDNHMLRALSCRFHDANSLVQVAFNAYWMGFEGGLLNTLQKRGAPVIGTRLENATEMRTRDGLFASLNTPEAVHDLLREVFGRYMPPAFEMKPEDGGYDFSADGIEDMDLKNGVRFSDLTAIVTNYFLRVHLGIDINKVFGTILYERKDVEKLKTSKLNSTSKVYTPKKGPVPPSLGSSVHSIIKNVTLSKAVEIHIREDGSLPNLKYTTPEHIRGIVENYGKHDFTIAELYEAVVAVLGLHEYAYLYRDGMPKEKSLAEIETVEDPDRKQTAGYARPATRPATSPATSPARADYSAVAAIAASLLVAAASALVGALRL